uniref:Uncharacterized protein n=1 Tax=Arundo donax TaxID=35708 RepID=A0A0A9DRF4_ARUDO
MTVPPLHRHSVVRDCERVTEATVARGPCTCDNGSLKVTTIARDKSMYTTFIFFIEAVLKTEQF